MTAPLSTTAAPARPARVRAAGGRPRERLPRAALLLPAGVAMLAGLDAGLLLLGVPAPVSTARLPEVHGVLMVLGFVGTVIALERAVALRRPVGFLAPALLGAGALLVLTPLPLRAGQGLLAAGAAALVAVYAALWRRQRDESVLVQALGAVAGTGAAMLWLGGLPVPLLLPWLVGFVVLTIGGERLELARIAMGPRAGQILVLLAGGLVAAMVVALLWPGPGLPLFGVALLALSGWLAGHDVARRTIRAAGLPRFAAGCMLAGYFWLGVAGVIWVIGGPALSGARYDAVIHAVFLGFTISMIMAHAPSILPAVLRVRLPYSPLMIAPAALLHSTLLLRVLGGDAYGSQGAWQAGGVGNEIALLLFVLVAAWSGLTAARAPKAAR
jgi:hypothetical protein